MLLGINLSDLQGSPPAAWLTIVVGSHKSIVVEFCVHVKPKISGDREVPLWPSREGPIAPLLLGMPDSAAGKSSMSFATARSMAFSWQARRRPESILPPGPAMSRKIPAKHQLRSPINAGIGSQEVQFRLEGTKGVERMSSGVMGWCASLTEDNTRVYPRARGAADRADGPYRTRLPAATRTYINSWKYQNAPRGRCHSTDLHKLHEAWAREKHRGDIAATRIYINSWKREKAPVFPAPFGP
jgi:hypothetical protein